MEPMTVDQVLGMVWSFLLSTGFVPYLTAALVLSLVVFVVRGLFARE